MTVRELIEALEKLPQDVQVIAAVMDGEPVGGVHMAFGDTVIVG